MATSISSDSKVIEFLQIAQYAIKRGDRQIALEFIGKAQDEIERPHFPALSPQEAIDVELKTIGETINTELLDRVRAAKRMTTEVRQ